MANTIYTYFFNQYLDRIPIYDSIDETNSASLLNHAKALEAYYIDRNGNKYLFWKKPDTKLQYLYYGGMTTYESDTFTTPS